MRVITGRFAEGRVYLLHCLAVLHPGRGVPVFEDRTVPMAEPVELDEADSKLVIEEGRRQLDRQASDLERLRTRGATLITVGLAEVALLASGAKQSFNSAWPVISAWILSSTFVLLGLGGAISILTARADMGRTDTWEVALTDYRPRHRLVAFRYAEAIGVGEATVAARLTVLRDAVLLLTVGALVYAGAWPFRD